MKNEPQKNGKEILKDAFSEYDRMYCENFPETETEVPDHAFWERNLQKILKKRYCNVWKPFSKSAIGIAAAFMIFVGSVTVMAEGSVLHWVSEFYETYVKIYFEDDDVQKAPTSLETIYMPTYIPENYTTETVYRNPPFNTILQIQWTAENGDYISFNQAVLDGEKTLDTENAEYSEIYHNDILYLHIKKPDIQQYIWNTNEYYFRLVVPPHNTDIENWEIIDSIQPYENTENKEF